MKSLPVLLTAVLALSGPLSLRAQTTASPTNAAHSDSLKLLRQTLADQARHPDKIIRTYTNLPPAEAQLASPAPVATREMPVVKSAAPADPAATPPPSAKAAAASALERQFLEGKLSSRQYQKALQDLERANAVPGAAAPKSKPPVIAASPKGTVGAPPVIEPAIATPPPQPSVRQQKVSEVEGKLDEMIRQKEARDAAVRAAQTNAIPTPPANLTKRQRLDFLLKQVVEGKLSDEEYKKQREKILAEPE